MYGKHCEALQLLQHLTAAAMLCLEGAAGRQSYYLTLTRVNAGMMDAHAIICI